MIWKALKCHAHSVLFLPMYSLLKGFRLSHALCILSCSLLVMHILFCSCLCKVRARVSDALSWALCNLSFLANFTLSDSTVLIRFIAFANWNTLCFSFGSKDMITVFTCLPSYRYSSFTLRAYLCWRHTYCQWPIVFGTNNHVKSEMLSNRHTHRHTDQVL